MPPIGLPTYVFRGTTKGYPGNINSIEMPYTCTTTHPTKALWFALECYHNNPGIAVVYVARTENLKHIKFGRNQLHKLEDEIGFFIQPASFYPLCEGFTHVIDFQNILKSFGIDGYHFVRKDNLSQLCKETAALNAKKTISIAEAMQPYLKK